MTNGSADVTRGEFDMLRQMVSQNNSRIESIDEHGTRGVGVLQSQIMDLTKDITRVETAFVTSMTQHHAEHKEEKSSRDRNRKWFISTTIAGVVMLCAILTLLVYILATIHGAH